ncbi:MAG TPA: RHS repeat-associated core domain-containing protein, partial [Gammaproteobacteria bacterium]|nr:RHS repeat-associated core domain-containing protein [Gammaproteobacteria bacterium]
HYNGRVYDPNIGRFTSADPYIQAPVQSQSLNRYSYVWNNPMTFTDPSGYAAAVGRAGYTCIQDGAKHWTCFYTGGGGSGGGGGGDDAFNGGSMVATDNILDFIDSLTGQYGGFLGGGSAGGNSITQNNAKNTTGEKQQKTEQQKKTDQCQAENNQGLLNSILAHLFGSAGIEGGAAPVAGDLSTTVTKHGVSGEGGIAFGGGAEGHIVGGIQWGTPEPYGVTYKVAGGEGFPFFLATITYGPNGTFVRIGAGIGEGVFGSIAPVSATAELAHVPLNHSCNSSGD